MVDSLGKGIRFQIILKNKSGNSKSSLFFSKIVIYWISSIYLENVQIGCKVENNETCRVKNEFFQGRCNTLFSVISGGNPIKILVLKD